MSNADEVQEATEVLLASSPENVHGQILDTANNDTNSVLDDDPSAEIPGYAPGVRIEGRNGRDGLDMFDFKQNTRHYNWTPDEEVMPIRRTDKQGPQTTIDDTDWVPSLTKPIHIAYKYINESVYFDSNPQGSRDQINYNNRPVITAITPEGGPTQIGEDQIRQQVEYWIRIGDRLDYDALQTIARRNLKRCGYKYQCKRCGTFLTSVSILMDHVHGHDE